MWSIKPYKSPPSECPKCSFENSGFENFIFIGAHILGQGTCSSCNTAYFHNWPIGHGEDFPMAFTSNGLATFPPKAAAWMAQPIISAVKNRLEISPKVNRTVHKSVRSGLLLNCLDPCFGHIIWKLFNTSYYQNTADHQGLVVLIPENCSWMVPDYVAEVWSLDVPLGALNQILPSIRTFINEISDNYQSLEVLPVRTHPDHSNIELKQFFGTDPFKLSEFQQVNPCVTFIWREDRFWLRTPMEEWLYLVGVKLQLEWLKPWFLFRQSRAIKKVASLIRKQLPMMEFQLTGIGQWGSFTDFRDLRQEMPTERWEKKWCRAYSRSHLVIGVHGSNMIIPTAHAAGFIELIPRHKIPFMSEDILMKYPPRFQTFLGRHLDLFSAPKLVAEHIRSIILDFPYLYKNTQAIP